jgi:hypothetical protein
MGAAPSLAAAFTPNPAQVGQPFDQMLTALDTCALLIRLRRSAIERTLDEQMRLQLLRGMEVDAPEGMDDALGALAPILEAALAFLRVHAAAADHLIAALGEAEARAS